MSLRTTTRYFLTLEVCVQIRAQNKKIAHDLATQYTRVSKRMGWSTTKDQFAIDGYVVKVKKIEKDKP